MEVFVDDVEFADDLVRFFRARECLAVKTGARLVEVAPIKAVTARADHVRISRLLAEWQAATGATGGLLSWTRAR